MESRRIVGEIANRGMEENTMAILDTSGFRHSKFSHLKDDRLTFLEAVRNASLLMDNGSAPSRAMFEAIFHILKDVDSLDLVMESYHLLIDLDKRFPRVYLSKEQSKSSSPSEVRSEFVIVEEAWVPFNFGLDANNERDEVSKMSKGSVDSLGFHNLIQEVSKMDEGGNSEALKTMFLKNILLLQYLISVLAGDFFPRNCAYKNDSNWTFLRESLVNMLMGSRKISYKTLIKDCLSLMRVLSQDGKLSEEMSYSEIPSLESSLEIIRALALALPEVEKTACAALKNFFSMVMELDSSRNSADMQGLTTRADGVRSPVVEVILDELIYDNDILLPFLQVFDEPKWKLKIIIHYFQKYIPKSVQTRRSIGSVDDVTLDGILKYLSNTTSTRSIIKKISPEVVQLLLAHAFKAYLALSCQHISKNIVTSTEGIENSSLLNVCHGVVSALNSLKREDRGCELLCVSRGALFTAATIISTNSH